MDLNTMDRELLYAVINCVQHKVFLYHKDHSQFHCEDTKKNEFNNIASEVNKLIETHLNGLQISEIWDESKNYFIEEYYKIKYYKKKLNDPELFEKLIFLLDVAEPRPVMSTMKFSICEGSSNTWRIRDIAESESLTDKVLDRNGIDNEPKRKKQKLDDNPLSFLLDSFFDLKTILPKINEKQVDLLDNLDIVDEQYHIHRTKKILLTNLLSIDQNNVSDCCLEILQRFDEIMKSQD